MMKQKILRFVNFLLFIVLLVLAISVVMYKITQGDEIWSELHEQFGIAFFVLIIGHIYLNWGWIKTTFFKKRK